MLTPKWDALVRESGGASEGVDHIPEEMEKMRASGSGIAKGVALALGADFAGDGDFDVVQGLLTKGGISAAAAAPLASGIVALAAGGYLVASTIRTLNELDLDELARAKAGVRELADRTLATQMQRFDSVMGVVQQHVAQRLSDRLHLPKAFARAQRLEQAIADAKESRFRFIERTERHPLLAQSV